MALQNTVSIHDLGAAIGTMNFTRTLMGTMLIAGFGAVVLAKAPLGAAPGSLGHAFLGSASVATFQTVFLAIAGTLAISFLAVILLEEKPLGETLPSPATGPGQSINRNSGRIGGGFAECSCVSARFGGNLAAVPGGRPASGAKTLRKCENSL